MSHPSNDATIKIRKSANLEKTRKIRVPRKKSKNRSTWRSCGRIAFIFLLILLYFLAPIRTKFLLLGIDRAPSGTMAGRSDTIMLISVNPLLPTIKILSIPRDLWVPIPSIGENRINTAHFFAETENPGSGPEMTLKTIAANFDVNVNYFVRFNLENFPQIIHALGGITIHLDTPMAGLPAGSNHLNGDQALAFLRSRSDGDDFFRIQQGQVFILSFIRELLKPASWPKIPGVLLAASQVVDSNIPFFLWPRLAFAFTRASLTGIQTYTIDRNMVNPTITSDGAQVLMPIWDLIRPFIREVFR